MGVKAKRADYSVYLNFVLRTTLANRMDFCRISWVLGIMQLDNSRGPQSLRQVRHLF